MADVVWLTWHYVSKKTIIKLAQAAKTAGFKS
jgi:hypothetical protein